MLHHVLVEKGTGNIMEKNARRTNGKQTFTYGDYLTWPDDERWELIDGVPYDMTPAPGRKHQEILGNLNDAMRNFLKGGACHVYFAPFDVRLPKKDEADEKVKTVVQPDLVVVCDEKKRDDKGCRGAPDLAVEILSPSTSSKDQVKKLNLYEKHGVREFWIIDPNGTVMIFFLQKNGRYGRPETYARDGKATSKIFPEMAIDLNTVFPAETRVVRESPREYRIR
jgi:Uma2 family endonuclease